MMSIFLRLRRHLPWMPAQQVSREDADDAFFGSRRRAPPHEFAAWFDFVHPDTAFRSCQPSFRRLATVPA